MHFLETWKICMPPWTYEACVLLKTEKQHAFQILKGMLYHYTKELYMYLEKQKWNSDPALTFITVP